MIAAAGKYLGTPYAWGGGTYDGPSLGIRDGGVADSFRDFAKVGFDCSGLVLYAAYQASNGTMKLPHLADLQRTMGQEIPKGSEQPGDLIAFCSPGSSRYHHIGIYIGNGMIRNAPQSGDVVKDSSLTGWANEKWMIRRLGESGTAVNDASTPGGAPAVNAGVGNDSGTTGKYLVMGVVGAMLVVGVVIVISGGLS